MRVAVKDENDAEKLSSLEKEHNFDFWSDIRIGKHVDVMTSPESRQLLESWLLANNLDWSVMISDVAALMRLEQEQAGAGADTRLGHNMDWTSYHPLEEIYGWFDWLTETYDFLEVENIGESFEGQQMIVMKVWKLS